MHVNELRTLYVLDKASRRRIVAAHPRPILSGRLRSSSHGQTGAHMRNICIRPSYTYDDNERHRNRARRRRFHAHSPFATTRHTNQFTSCRRFTNYSSCSRDDYSISSCSIGAAGRRRVRCATLLRTLRGTLHHAVRAKRHRHTEERTRPHDHGCLPCGLRAARIAASALRARPMGQRGAHVSQ